MQENPAGNGTLRQRIWNIIFLSDTKISRAFDIAILILIGFSVITLMLESIPTLGATHASTFRVIEWIVTILFTLEYLLRLYCVKYPYRYVFSFFGIIDLLSTLPTYISLIFPGAHFLMMIRVLRLLRMFRILKMVEYVGEAGLLLNALSQSRRKIVIFFTAVLTLVIIEGTLMYVLEADSNPGFASIPRSIYWSIVTITTVGFGDITPISTAGKFMASVIMLSGFAIIAVPTGIITSEIQNQLKRCKRRCKECGWSDHDPRARFCQQCGHDLPG